MTASNRQGTFWVIDGLRIKKKSPFIVTQINRVFPASPEKQVKDQIIQENGHELMHGQQDQKFFTERSYQNIADKQMDYGMMHFSSLSSMRGGDLFPQGHAQQLVHNFSYYNSGEFMKWQCKKSIFENKFSMFQFITEQSGQMKDVNNMMDE